MAIGIPKNHLTTMSDAILDGDFERYLSCVALPLKVTTNSSTFWIETEEMLEEGFDAFSDMMLSLNVNCIARRAITVTGITNRRIFGRYASSCMKDRDEIVPLYTADITLELQEDLSWKTSSIDLQIDNRRWPIMVPRPSETESAYAIA